MILNDSKLSSLTYQAAGVDINAGNRLVERIKSITAATMRPEVLTGIGGFNALFELPLQRYKHPILVSGTDGVGTKLKLAADLGRYDTIGIDLVAMCVNDVLVSGAEPLFFLDYYAVGQLAVDQAATVISGIAQGCVSAGCALIGGETAEMPGLYRPGDYDLAGFCVGIVEKDNLILPNRVTPGDVLIGIASSGFHSNGYSLIRKIISDHQIDLTQELAGVALENLLLKPTRIYVASILNLIRKIKVNALAHITGGGLTENIPRVLPNNTSAFINLTAWERPLIFNWIQNISNITEDEMLRVFNCGIGMVVCIAESDSTNALQMLRNAGETCWIIGKIEQANGTPKVYYH